MILIPTSFVEKLLLRRTFAVLSVSGKVRITQDLATFGSCFFHSLCTRYCSEVYFAI